MTASLYQYPVQHLPLESGVTIAYTDTGAGPYTLLFIHGLANYLPVWNDNIAELSQHFRCIAIDLPGNGQSSRAAYPYGMHFFAEAVAAFIEQLNLTNVCLVGHSMGGQIATTVALRYPQLVQKLVLCAPAGFEHFSEDDINLFKSALTLSDFLHCEEAHIKHSVHKGFDTLTETAHQIVGELIDLIRQNNRDAYSTMIEQCINGMLQEPTDHLLHQLACPVLVLFGTNDKLIPNRFLHRIPTAQLAATAAAQIPNAQLQLLEPCGHFVHIEQAAKVNEAILQFLTTDNP